MCQSRDCDVCGNNEKKLIFKQEFAAIDGVAFLKGYDVVSCKKCGFLFADKIPSQIEFNRYYMVSSKYEDVQDTISQYLINLFSVSLNFIEKCINNENKEFGDMDIVDVGCATGDFLRFLHSKNYKKLNGVDPSA